MRNRLVATLKKVWPVLRWVLLVLLSIVLVSGLIVLSDKYKGWGLNKTLWEWLDLLIIPAALAVGAWWVNRNSQKIEREIASERNQEAALQAYLDRMTELLLEKGLRNSKPEDEVRTVARTRTLTVLRGLGAERKGTVVRFLIEAGLISVQEPQEGDTELKEPIISLEGANLERASLADVVLRATNLKKANLRGADLREAFLKEADLVNAKLIQANLREAYLEKASLDGADLTRADLTGANLEEARLIVAQLRRANLEGANLPRVSLMKGNLAGANLTRANLTGANLWKANLEGAILEGVTLPDGRKWIERTDMSRFTNPSSGIDE